MGSAGSGTYTFDSDLSLEQMLATLNAGGPWSWAMRDSSWYGDYLRTWPSQGRGWVGILEQRQSPVFLGGPEEPRFLLWVSDWPAKGESSLPLAELDRIIRQQILPAIGARGAQAAVGF